MIFDLHCDTIWKISEAKRKGAEISLKKSYLQIDEEKLKKGNYFGHIHKLNSLIHLGLAFFL